MPLTFTGKRSGDLRSTILGTDGAARLSGSIGCVTNAQDCQNPIEIVTRDQAEAAGAQILALHQQIKQQEIKATRVAFAAQKLTSKISELRSRLLRYELAVQAWAEKNRQEMGEQKSLVMRHIVIAFKNARPAVKFLEGWTVAKVLEKLRQSKKLRELYIRTKEELNRQQILADARPEAGKLDPKTMRGFGIEVASEEFFYIEPKLETAV